MKRAILVLAFATIAASESRDKRSYAHTQAYPVPVSVHTVVRPSNTLPVYEYPESTQIDTHFRNVYTVKVPIVHSVTLEQPGHSRQVVYHAPPALNTVQQYHAPPVYQTPQVYHTPQVYQTPQVYHSPQVYRTQKVYTVPQTVYQTNEVYAPSQPWVYQRHGSTWC